MRVKASPFLVGLLVGREAGEHNDVLIRLWLKTEKEVEQKKELSRPKEQDIAAPKRARFLFD